MNPRPGDLLFVGAAASVQFSDGRGFAFRVIAVDDRVTYDGWIWLDGYQLDASGEAIDRRRIFVRLGGLRTTPGESPGGP